MVDMVMTASSTFEGLIENEVRPPSNSPGVTLTMLETQDQPSNNNKDRHQETAQPRRLPSNHSNLKPLSSQEALIRLHDDINLEISAMERTFASRSFLSWLIESISFRSELSKMRWPSVVFMTGQAVAHFVVAFILNVENLATNWVGFQGFILTALLIFNLAVNLWDTKLRFKELLMKSIHIRDLIRKCSHDKLLLRKWKHFNWKSANAKTLFTPKSPCVHQTLIYRDESCLNLPDFLLVRGDIIHLYPGDLAPGDCISLNTVSRKQALISNNVQGDDNVWISLKEGEMFHSLKTTVNREQAVLDTVESSDKTEGNALSHLRAHSKLKRAQRGMDFLMLSTPYLKSLRISLQQSHKRPVNSIEKECFIVSRKYFETYVIPMVFVLSTIVTAVHYGYLDLTDSDQEIKTISIAYLLLRPSLTIMPFLPWMFPCFWMAVNAYGSARLLCCAENQRNQKNKHHRNKDLLQDQSPNWAKRMSANQHGQDQFKSPGTASHLDNLLATPTAAGSSDHNRHEDDLQDLQSNIRFTQIFKTFVDLICAKSGHVWRSSSLLQVLGCLTSLCCIDKVGILSWPNPTAEKVFILAESQEGAHGHHLGRQRQTSGSDRANQSNATSLLPHGQLKSSRNTDENQTFDVSSGNGIDIVGHHQVMTSRLSLPESFVHDEDVHELADRHTTSKHLFTSIHHQSSGRAEILDVSQAFTTYRSANESISLSQSSRLQFDDPHWIKYLENLKPLGMAILMNNCCDRSFGDYFRFNKHISYESILCCNLSPVVKRRCICDLAKLIGFSRDSIKSYKYTNQLGVYRLVDQTSMKKGKLVSSLENSTRLKLPFPNMVCNIHQDTITGGYQVFSQGTADLVLDSCLEYWNGKQLIPLDESTRKKIMDFYHRTSLTSYCSALAYSPLLKDHNLQSYYIEMPAEGSKCTVQPRKVANEHYEEFLRSQVINVPQPFTQPIQSDSSESARGVHFYGNHRGTLNASSLSSSPVLSSPNIQEQRHFHQADAKPAIHQMIRRHLSAEDLLSDVSLARNQTHDIESKKATKRRMLDEALDELTDQVFVGMVAMQYQACPDFVMLVEQLEHACIRFVHFSKENELRSRVFSEKMGLESGWNCHVSLQSDQALDKAYKTCTSSLLTGEKHLFKLDAEGLNKDDIEMRSFCPPTRISDLLVGFSQANRSWMQLKSATTVDDMGNSPCEAIASEKRNSLTTSDEGTLHSWKSLPSLAMRIMTKVSLFTGNHRSEKSGCQSKLLSATCNELDLQSEKDHEIDKSESIKSSEEEEGFDTLAFDMSNRAKLPKGIENIRPHLETVDNIPLQVSLFTDCTPILTKEMIEIMQDYGEIVCVIGSSSSRLNTPVFLQANASIAIEPLIPKNCNQNKPRRLSGQRHQRKRTSSTKAERSKLAQQVPNTKKTKKNKKDKHKIKPVAVEANQPQPSMLRVNNPRDRLGIGPTLFSEQVDQTNPNKRYQLHSKSAQNSSTSSSSSSSSSAISSGSYHSKLSQSLSDSSSSASSNEDDLSSCSSSDDLFEQERHENHESHDGDDDETMDEEGFAKIESVDEFDSTSDSLINEFPEPSSLASRLASLPCSYNYDRKEQVHLYSLIMEARHFTFKMKNTFVCMICFALSISSAQFLASILFLPPMLSSGLTIWLTVVVVPLMSFSLMGTTMDSQVMKIAVGKNLQLKPENITFFVICYLIKFIPSIIVVVLNFGFIIAHSCKLTGFGSSSLGPCWMFTYVRHNGNSTGSKDDSGDEDLLWSSHLLTAQVCAAFLMVLYFVVISSGFVHRSHLMWQRSPTRNRFWVFSSLTLIIGQLFYNQLVLQVNLSSSRVPYEFLASLPLHIWLISFMWPVLLISINLLVKRAEIKATIRQQRRARFDFNTKLGMNSPF